MWAASFLLLVVGSAAFQLEAFGTERPETTSTDNVEATSAIPVRRFPWQNPSEEYRVERLAMIAEQFREQFFKLSYADIKQFIPDEIIDFFENLSFNDAQHLQEAITVFQQAVANIPGSNAHQALQVAWKDAINHLKYFDSELANKVADLSEWYHSHFFKLKRENIRRTGLWIEGWFAAVKKADGRATEADLKTLKVATEEFTKRMPFLDQDVNADWAEQFPKLKALYESGIYVTAVDYYFTYIRRHGFFYYEN